MPLNQKIDKEIFRTIFIDHWDSFKERHPGYIAPQYEKPVQKMLGCGKESGGYSEYWCVHCGRDVRRIGFSCKSCFCLSCSKKYVDEFVGQVSRVLHAGLVYRHMVLTIPEQLRDDFYKERHDGDLLSAFMRCGHECLEDVVSTVLRRRLKIGTIVVVQTHGRSGHYNPHLHIIMTSGGINENTDSWFDLRYFNRFMKRLIMPGIGFQSFHTAWRTLRGYETMHMIRKGQVKGIGKGNIKNQIEFIENLFGLAA